MFLKVILTIASSWVIQVFRSLCQYPYLFVGPYFFSTSPDFKLQASELVWHTYLCVNFTYLYPFAVFQRDIDFI